MRIFGLFVLVGLVAGCAERPRVSSSSSPTPVVVDSSPSPVRASPSPLASEAPSEEKDTRDLFILEDIDVYEPDLESLEVPPPNEKMLRLGKRLYVENCAVCHDPNDPVGYSVKLEPPPNDLTDLTSFKYGQGVRWIYWATAYGIEGTGMAPWGDILEEDEMWAICHYVNSIQKK